MQAFNPLQSMLQGQELGREQQARNLYGQLSQSQNPEMEPEFQQLMAIDPARANAIVERAYNGDVNRLNRQVRDSKQLLWLSQNAEPQAVNNYIEQIAPIYAGTPQGEGISEFMGMANRGDYQGIAQKAGEYLQLFDPNFKSEGEKGGKTAGEKIANYEYYDKLRQTNPEGAERFAQSANLNPQERSSLAVETNKLKEQDKKRIDRVTGFASSGVEAADNLGSVKRTMDLLDSVKTGGFNNAAFKAKSLFGVEAADEGELSFLLSKNVLSQLKNIFGAAFTAQEGERLEKIEASFGRNTETNKRLLERVYKSTERAARRGIRAAQEIGDDFTANEIKVALGRVKDITIDDNNTNTNTNTNEVGLSPEEQAELDALRRELNQ